MKYHPLNSQVIPMALDASRYQTWNHWISVFSDLPSTTGGARIAVVLNVI